MNISAFAERSVDCGLEEWIHGTCGWNKLFKLKWTIKGSTKFWLFGHLGVYGCQQSSTASCSPSVCNDGEPGGVLFIEYFKVHLEKWVHFEV